MNGSKKQVQELLALAGVEINGPNPWDIQVKDERFYKRVLSEGSLGLGESYMDGWWEAASLDQLFFKIQSAGLKRRVKPSLRLLFYLLRFALFNMQNKRRATQVAEQHYNLGNELYTNFLDPNMQYSCGYFQGTDDLAIAQKQKLDLICRKLDLKPGDRLLDVGCGWGGLAKYAAENYGCHVTGINISDEQIKFARDWTKGLPVEIVKIDYRDLKGKFNKIASVGMFEHVGYKNYRKYLSTVRELLTDDGLFLLHTIGSSISVVATDPWINKHIFPNGMLPSIKQIGKAMEKQFVMEDWHNFGAYYDPTLMAWFKNFDSNWSKIKHLYDERFYRMWKYYLLSCAGSFRARKIQLWQIVMTKTGVIGGYRSVR
jgi:cyclopropane-fatty-acyl-phospholipid synthase